MNRGLSRVALLRTARRSWQGLLRSIASKGEKLFAAGAWGAPKERSHARFHRSEGPAAYRQPTPYGCERPFLSYAVGLIGVARYACRKPRNASRPRSNQAITIA
jgi:hypothetical protein